MRLTVTLIRSNVLFREAADLAIQVRTKWYAVVRRSISAENLSRVLLLALLE